MATLLLFMLAGCSSIDSAHADFQSQPPVHVGAESGFDVPTDTAVSVAGGLGAFMFGGKTDWIGLPAKIFDPKAALILYIIYDPLAPNWKIEEKRLSEDSFYLTLSAKSFRTGGDGESLRAVKRRAAKLQRAMPDYKSYRIVEYTEGIDSSTPFTHRVAEATIQLMKTETVSKAP